MQTRPWCLLDVAADLGTRCRFKHHLCLSRPSLLSSCLRRERWEEVGPCDHVSHEERQNYQTSIPWCWISFASLRGRKQNNLKKKKKKDLLHFLLMTTICFITRQLESGLSRRRDRKQDLDLSEGQTLFMNLVCGLWSFQFCRILTDVGGMCEKKTTTKQNVKTCTQSCCGLITCTLIIVYYDDDMTECIEDDWQLSLECWSFFVFFCFF